MKFNSIMEVKKALTAIRLKTKFDKKTLYTVMFKKAVMVFADKQEMSMGELAEETGLTYGLVYRWHNQYKDSLYEEDAVYAVSQKSKEVNTSILKRLKQEITEITKQIEYIEILEAAGFKVEQKESKRKLKVVG